MVLYLPGSVFNFLSGVLVSCLLLLGTAVSDGYYLNLMECLALEFLPGITIAFRVYNFGVLIPQAFYDFRRWIAGGCQDGKGNAKRESLL